MTLARQKMRIFWSRRRIPVCPVIIAILILLTVHEHAPVVLAGVGPEYIIKAAMIRNFAKFTRWPEGSDSRQKKNTMLLCLMGDESIHDSFAGIRGKTVRGKTIALKWTDNLSGLGDCDLLFVNRETRTNMTRIMKAIAGRPVLTIGETSEFTRAGGMITFFFSQGRIRFRINPDAVRRSGLKVSSTLLELATIVYPSKGKHEQ